MTTNIAKDIIPSAISNFLSFCDRRRQLLIVTLHRVNKPNSITSDTLRDHFEFLLRDYRLILPSQLDINSSAKRTALITIDDCHHDAYDMVFHLAKQMGIPLTIFVPTDFFFRNEWLWVDRARFGLQQIPSSTPLFLDSQERSSNKSLSHNQIIALLKTYHPSVRESLLDRIFQDHGVTIPKNPVADFRPVSIANMQEMLSSGLVEVASHTISHPVLTALSNEEMRKELVESKDELEDFSGKKIDSFCYPNGLSGDYNEQTKRALLRAGYEKIFTSVDGLNYLSTLNLFELSRVHVHQRLAVFKKMASGCV